MWVAFANAKATHIFSAKILAYMSYLMIKVLTICLTSLLLNNWALTSKMDIKGLIIPVFPLYGCVERPESQGHCLVSVYSRNFNSSNIFGTIENCSRHGSHKGLIMVPDHELIDWLCWGLTTRQPLRVILCRLPEKGRKEIEERVEEMKERDREERGTGMKVKKQKK